MMAKAAGASLLRGGAFKPRTSPYAFQGLGEKGLRILAEVREQTGLPVVTCVQAQVHATLSRASYDQPIQGYGRLLRGLGGTVPVCAPGGHIPLGKIASSPPSQTSSVPVTKPASSEARKSAAAAWSAG